jgi:hypothetical protein
MYKNAYASAYHSAVKGTNIRAFPKFRIDPNFSVFLKNTKLDVISWAQVLLRCSTRQSRNALKLTFSKVRQMSFDFNVASTP